MSLDDKLNSLLRRAVERGLLLEADVDLSAHTVPTVDSGLKAEIWIGIRTAAELAGIAQHKIRKALREGAIPARLLLAREVSERGNYVMRLLDFEKWEKDYRRLMPGRPSKSSVVIRMILDGYSVRGICEALHMKRGAVLRFWQRECLRDKGFPARDHKTDRRVGLQTATNATSEKLSREQKKSGPWENTVKLPSPSSLLKAIRSSGLSANSRNF